MTIRSSVTSTVCAALVTASFAIAPRPSSALVDGELNFGEQSTLLDDHNFFRSETANGDTASQPAASNMNKLFWDNGLAAVAQAWADQCVFQHNANRISQLDPMLTRFSFDPGQVSVGENLFASTASATLPTLQNGIQNWYDEHSLYTYSSQACSGVCGHYTQVVWANTRYVGCGWKFCPTLAGTSLTNASYLVCNYEASGNFFGEDPYEAGTACSACDSDRLACDDGQCGGCASPDWDFCSDYYSNCADLAAFCPSDCDLSNPDPLCTGCRATCNTCTAEMLAPEEACVEVPIPCSEGCDSFDACLDAQTLQDLTCDTESGFCVPQAVSCNPNSCVNGACASGGVPALGFGGSVAVIWAMAAAAIFGLTRTRRRG